MHAATHRPGVNPPSRALRARRPNLPEDARMNSFSLPDFGLAASFALGALVFALCALSAYQFWQLRFALPKRFKVLEDALRVYNSANATLGCRITELDTALQQSRTALPAQPAEPAVRAVQGAAQLYEARAAAS